MTCGKGRGLIQKEELGIGARTHDRVLKPFECQYTADPCLVLPTPCQKHLMLRVMNDPAVTHACAPGGGGDNVTEGRYSVLEGHLARTLAR